MNLEISKSINKPSTKSDYAFNFLKEKIISGDLPPGVALNVHEIAQILEISEIPIREALKQLAVHRLVKIEPHKGAFVNEYSQKEIEDNLEVRLIIEPIITKLAAPNINSAHIKALNKIIEEMENLLESDCFLGYGELNRKFHKIIYSACPNMELKRIIHEIWDICDWAMAVFIMPSRIKQSIEEHKSIVKALEERDYNKVEKITLIQKQKSFKGYLNDMKKSATRQV